MFLDSFRAPMTPEERARRLAVGLDQYQIENLDRWGYPFLFLHFHFHMTLTNRIEHSQRKNVVHNLRQCYKEMCGARTIIVSCLTLLKQESTDIPFRVVKQVQLSEAGP